MNWTYFKIAWRVLLKNRFHTLINILGLGIGFSVSVLMMIFVFHQLSFDNFHDNKDRIYRLIIEGSMADGKVLSAAITSGDVYPELQNQVPEVEIACRVFNWGTNEVIVDHRRFTDDLVLWVDSGFFNMFSFPLIEGNPTYALLEPATVVITQKTADKYFPDNNILNNTIQIGGINYRVTGLVPDPPSHSHLQFDMLASFQTLVRPDFNIIERSGLSFPTYVLMRQGANRKDFLQKTISVADNTTNERFSPLGMTVSHSLQPLGRIFLHSPFNFDMSKRGDIRNVYIFSFLALAVILIAVFNFVNLVTAQSEKRTREIGMRKVMGATRKDLIIQFIGESVLVTFFAFVLSLALNELFIDHFSGLLDENFRLEYWHNAQMLFTILLSVVTTGILAGLYPAIYLSRFQPVVVLKGLSASSGSVHLLRKVLVIFQFSISIFLITSVLLFNQQVRYMKNKDLGFNRENIITVRGLTQNIRNTYKSLQAELLQHPSISHVTASHGVPGETMSLQNSYKKGDDPNSAVMMYENNIQHGYLQTFGIRLVEGRDFDPMMSTDTSAIIINQAAVRKLGLENPIGEEITVWQHTGKIIGVVADFNFMSLHNEIDPLALTMHQSGISRISIRFAQQDTQQTLAWIQQLFENSDPNYTFEYFFVDDTFAQMYRKEEHLNRLISAAAIIAIIISFMGLYALTSFTIRKKIKEIGIRKTLGASLNHILHLVLRDLWRWVVIGNLIAWPIAWFVVARWQQNFAFQLHIPQYWYLFLFAGLMAALIGLMATLFQAVSAANANPLESLKTE